MIPMAIEGEPPSWHSDQIRFVQVMDWKETRQQLRWAVLDGISGSRLVLRVVKAVVLTVCCHDVRQGENQI